MVDSIRTPDQRLRVFISSTLGELAEERTAARSAVEQLRLIPVMFELGARPHPPRALYSSYLDQSDVFVGIYWQRYGWVAPDMDISGLEHELLLSEGMPRLLYIKHPAPEIEPDLARMVDQLEREGASSYRVFSTAEELRELLSDDLAILLTERFGDSRPIEDEVPAPRHNLPAQPTTFIGREAELDDLRALVEDPGVRLITLRGPGGTGKTRLAIRLAFEVLDRFPDGVHFVDLSAERETDRAFAALARVLPVSVANGVRPLDALKEHLRDREVLVILDNFEQAMSAAVGVVELLEHCPRLTVLVTSRESLNVRGEHDVGVPPLSLPDGDDLEAASASEAVRLFCDRAAAIRPDFRLTAANVEDVTAICRLLDGLPLAVELAAARIQLLGLHDLRVRLGDRLDLLRGGPRDLPARQQTLRAAIDWSYDLLDDDERRLLRAFSTFDGARLADVEEAAARVPELADLDVIEVMGSLVTRSLVQSAQGADGGPRLSMLRTIRTYASERLGEEPEVADAVRNAHAQQYADVGARLRSQVATLGRGCVLSSLGDDLENLRSAWHHWLDRDDVEQLSRLLAPLWGFYDARGDYRSAIALGTQLLELLATAPESPERRSDEFAVRMNVVRTEVAVRGYTADAEQMVMDALGRTEVAGDARRRYAGLRVLGYLRMMRAEFDQVGELADELLAIAEADRDPILLTDAHLLAGLGRAWRDGIPAGLESYCDAVRFGETARTGYVDFRIGTHPAVVANVVTALSQWIVGTPDTARTTMDHALRLAAELEHPYSVAYATHHAALLDLWGDDMVALAARADELQSLAEERDYPVWRALSQVLGGLATARTGDVEAGLARAEEGFQAYQGLSAPPVFWPALLMIRALTFGTAGRLDEALAAIDEALATLPAGDPVGPDVLLVRAGLLLATSPDDTTEAESVFEAAAALAVERGCRLAELQALTHLAGLRRATPSGDDAHRRLREVYGGLTEGFDLPALVAANVELSFDRHR